jgi:hypothetical protein
MCSTAMDKTVYPLVAGDRLGAAYGRRRGLRVEA